MKNTYILFVVLLISSLGFGQTTIYSQGFETDLSGYSHTPSQTPSTDPGDQYFYRAEPSDGAIYETGSDGPYTNVTGSWLFVGSNPNTFNGSSPGILTFDPIDVTGYSNLVLEADFGGVPNDWDASDELSVEYSWDNSTWSTLYSFSSPITNDPLALENNAVGGSNTANGTVLTYALQTIISDNFTGSGTTLYLRIVCNANANYEAFGVDNIVLQGLAVGGDTSIQFASTSASVSEDSGTYDLVVQIANEDAVATTFDVVLTSGDATDIDSYTTQSETFPGSSTTDITVTVTITDDAIIEGDEDFVFEIQNVAGGNSAAVGSNDTFTLTILANDVPPPTEGWQITAEDTSFVIDFDTTVSGVNEGTFDGSGFTSTPVSGQLDSDAWESTGMSDGALSYGGSATSGDYARGTSSGGVTSGGFYAFDTGAGNNTLGFQGTGGDFTPGTITLRAQNQTGNTVTTADLAYLIYVFNDQGRSNTMNFSYSTDDVTYTDVSAMDFTSEEIADGVPAWSSNPRSTSITGLSIADGGYLYLRWSSDDDTGSGSRDELALDDIDLTFNPSVGGTTYTFTGTWAPSDPNGTATAGDDIVIASGNATIDTNTTCNSVTVNPGAGLTVDTGVTLTTSNGLALESTSTTYSSLILDGFVVGTLTYDRHVNINGSGETGSNDLISAPLTGQSFDDFQNANPNILSNTGATLFLFGPFDKTIGDYVTYADGETATLDPGVGYRAASNDNSTFTFTGTANNGNIDIDIQNAGPDEAEWNLIGNPYPSYLNVQDFLNHDVGGVTNLQLFNAPTAAIYGYDGSAQNGWTIYNLATTTPTTVIAPGQGFFVSADSTNDDLYDLQFTPAMRSTGTTDDFIVGRTAPLTHFTVNLSSSNNTNKTEFYFNSAASEGFDLGYDAKLWGDTNTDLGIYSHLVQNNAGIAMALQTLNDSNLTGVTIPLGVSASNGEQIRFAISESTLPESVNVYLEDTVKNTITLLNTGDYVFTPSATISGTGRFFLRISENALSSVEDNLDTISIYALQNSKELVVTGQLEDSAYIELFDIQGRKVLTTTLDSRALENRIDVSALTVGVYVAAVQNNGHQKSQKVIIK